MARHPSGIILSGGPKSVNDEPAPLIDPAVYDTIILGICYGAQLLVRQLGGEVAGTGSASMEGHRSTSPPTPRSSSTGRPRPRC